MSEKGGKVEVSEDLLEIKDEVKKSVGEKQRGSEIRRINSKLDKLTEKVDEIKEALQSDSSSGIKTRKKKEIICFIKENDGTTASELSDHIDLSRTRCSEYLNEMKREGILECEKKGRKKYYNLKI
ncbi:MAG: winged helix-turn-helix domain-containing protein [Candidatus Aenigmatarchaeota archaeon]